MLPAAERHDLRGVIADVLVTKGTALGNIGRVREGAALLAGGRELALSVGDHHAALRAYINGTGVLDLDDPRVSFESSRTGLALARRVGRRAMGYVLLTNASLAAITVGEWDWATDEASHVFDEMEREDRFIFGDPMLCIAALRGEDRGRLLAEFEATAAPLTDPQSQANARGQRAWDAFADRRWADAAASWAEAAELQSFGAYDFLTNRGRAVTLARDLDGVHDNLARLRGLGFHGRMFDATVRRHEAAVAALEGRHADALGLYRGCLSKAAEVGATFAVAMTGLEMAWLLDPADPEVMAAADRSREILAGLRATTPLGWLEEALAQTVDSTGRPAHGPTAEQVQVQVEDALS